MKFLLIKTRVRKFGCTAALLFVCLHATVAVAVEKHHPRLVDPFYLSVGVFAPKRDISFQVDGQIVNQPIHFEDIFAGDKDRRFGFGNLHWRFGERWSVSGQFWSVGRKSSAVLDRDIGFRDTQIDAGSFVRGSLSTTVNRLFFGRTLWDNEISEFGLGAGLHYLTIRANLDASIQGTIENPVIERNSAVAHAPLPNIGIWYMRELTPTLLLDARFDLLAASVGEYSGSLINVQVGLDWSLSRHLGLGFYYNSFDLSVDVERDNWRGHIENRQRGPHLALFLTF